MDRGLTMHPHTVQAGESDKEGAAVFCRTIKDNIDHEKLYERSIGVAEEIMRLGLK
ncbi:MAG: hypothetical protein II072_04900 [Clostridia bacterium]|nr:hypothetical protein [Clostridia bacterium]MBQ2110538.1 hypothetical protein [Clostridia bacterium]